MKVNSVHSLLNNHFILITITSMVMLTLQYEARPYGSSQFLELLHAWIFRTIFPVWN